jgi:hypothetical protein
MPDTWVSAAASKRSSTSARVTRIKRLIPARAAAAAVMAKIGSSLGPTGSSCLGPPKRVPSPAANRISEAAMTTP